MSYFRPYKYIKDEPFNPIYTSVSKKFLSNIIFYPAVFILLGLFFMATQIFIPLNSSTVQDKIEKPVSSSVLGVASGFGEFTFFELDYTFGEVSRDVNIPTYYYLTIPKLDIDSALVETSPNDLNPDDALGHYAGSSMPGDCGNSFIYGHSVLPAFYNPSNYRSIFSTLHKLSKGDTFQIVYNNREFNYVVLQERVLLPEEVKPEDGFSPEYLNESTVTLMTCYPPGTKMKRLLIDAKLIN